MKGETAICASPKCAKEFVKKKLLHHCCSNSCRATYHRTKDGDYQPEFYKALSNRPVYQYAVSNDKETFAKRAASSVFNGAISPAIMQSIGRGSFIKNAVSSVVSGALMPMIREQIKSGKKVRFSPVDEEINYWIDQKKYWSNERAKIIDGVFPVRTVAGAVLGGFVGYLLAKQLAPNDAVQGIGLGLTIGAGAGVYFENKAIQQREMNADMIINNADAKIHEADQKMIDLRNRKFEVDELVQGEVLQKDLDGYYSVTDQYVNTVMKAEDYRSMVIPKIEFMGKNGAYKLLLGEARVKFHKIVTGLPEQGKTSYCVKFANYFAANHGKVLYLPAEQSGRNLDFQKVLEFNNAKGFSIDPNVNDYSFDELLRKVGGFDLVILDSVNYMNLSAVDLKKLNKEVAIMAVMQSTKDGSFKGGQEFYHDCDKFVTVEKFGVYASKSRGTDPNEPRQRIPLDSL